MKTALYSSPIGPLQIQLMDNFIVSIKFIDQPEVAPAPSENDVILIQCLRQLEEYFNGTLKEFTFPIYQEGTDFQKKVWKQLISIPYGKTISYAELSRQMGNIKMIRAVGTTNGKNNLAIVVPCHRVIGSNNHLTGYSGGLWRKRWLLEHEVKHTNGARQLNLL